MPSYMICTIPSPSASPTLRVILKSGAAEEVAPLTSIQLITVKFSCEW